MLHQAAYINCGGLQHFGMMSIDSEPAVNTYSGNIGNQKEMCEFVLYEAKSFLQDNLDLVPQ